MQVHRHLWEAHPDGVELRHEEGEGAQFFFAVRCPVCEEESVRRVNPGGGDPDFLEEFRREVSLVAFDILLYHLHSEHPEAVGMPPWPEEAADAE